MEYPFKDLLPLDEVLEREGYYKDWTHLDPEVFYSLTQISEYIKTKGFGVDVRLLIAQLAEHFGLKTTQVVDLANLLQQKFTNLEGVTQSFTNNINSLVAQMKADKDAVIANVTVDSEVILARGGKATLQARLDDSDAQLAQTMKVINVTQPPYNAKGDGVTDDSISIKQAIDDAILHNKRVYFPKTSASYYIASPIIIRGTRLKLFLEGEKGALLTKGATPYPIFDIDSSEVFTGAYGQRVQDVYISSLTFESPSSQGTAIKLRTFGRIFMDDVYAYRFATAYDFGGGSEAYFNNLRWAGGNLGLKLEALGVDMQTVYFTDCSFSNGSKGVSISDTYDVHFTRTVFTKLSIHSFLADSGTQNVYFVQCHFELGYVSPILLNSFIGVTFDKCEFAQTKTGQAPPIQVNNSITKSKLRIINCYHEMLSLIPTVLVKETSKVVDIVMENNLPQLVNEAIQYEKTVNEMTEIYKPSGNSINIFNRDFTKGFLGYNKTSTSVLLTLDDTNKITGDHSIKFNTTNGYWDFFAFSTYGVEAIQGDVVNIDIIFKGEGFGAGIVRGILSDLSTGASSEVVLQVGSGNTITVEDYPNGFTRRIISYVVPDGKKMTNIRISNSQNYSVNLYLDYVDITLNKQIIHTIARGTSIPTEGTFIVGDKLINRTPSAGGYEGWVYTSTGWKGYGLIQA